MKKYNIKINKVRNKNKLGIFITKIFIYYKIKIKMDKNNK